METLRLDRLGIAPHNAAVTDLPIEPLIPRILQALEQAGTLVLQAPPGAGKTTRVPLALTEAPFLAGRTVIVLEPRRLAARMAARHMAASLGEAVRRIEAMGVVVARQSSIYETEPVGYLDQPYFLNQVIEAYTEEEPDSSPPLQARALLGALQGVERDLGREQNFRDGPRVIDIDLLLYGSLMLAQQSAERTLPIAARCSTPCIWKWTSCT